MGRAVFITSFKGGVGKTTVTANLAASFTLLDKTVLVVDADFSNRCLDIVLGLESSSVFDCYDILTRRSNAANAIVRSERNPRLFFLPAPVDYKGEPIEQERFIELFSELKKQYDYILIDSSAEASRIYLSFASICDDALVVSFHQSTAIRAAEKTATTLSSLGFSNIRLIINSFHKKDAESGRLPNVYDIISRSHIRLIGVVPYDGNVRLDQEAGFTAFDEVSRGRIKSYEAAFLNIARRLCGEQIPLLRGVYRTKKLKKYFATI